MHPTLDNEASQKGQNEVGFRLPDTKQKPDYVQNLFSRVAGYYDLMNDVMSFGMHRVWKHEAIRKLRLKDNDSVLDVCCGTGDLEAYLHKANPNIKITGLDFCQNMLDIARKRFSEKPYNIDLIQGDAMALPFPNESFDSVIISYGLRNVANYELCLSEMQRVLKKNGRLVVLDMSHPTPFVAKLSSFYRYVVMPQMGKLVANDPDAYRYLSNSIKFYLNQTELKNLMTGVGLHKVDYENKMGGICAIHWGSK